MSAPLKLSASSLPRLRACLASGLLKWADYNTVHAVAGTGRHAEQETAIGVGDMSKLPGAVRDLVAGMDVRAEVSVVYNIATHTARELGVQLGRQYGTLLPFEVPGTLDMLAVGNGRVVVGDAKGFEEVDAPERNWQTLLYALAVALIYRVSEVTVAIYYLSRPDSEPLIATLDVLDLDAFAEDLKALYLKAGIASTNPHAHETVGPQCRYCPAFLDCDKQKALALEVGTDVAASKLNSVIPLENDIEAADALEFVQRLRLLLKRADAAIAGYAIGRPFRTHDGRMYGEMEKRSPRQIDGDMAYAYIREIHGQEIADAASSREVSQASIDRALRRHNIPHPNKVKDDIVAHLTKHGAVTQKTKVELGFYDAPVAQLKAGGQ